MICGDARDAQGQPVREYYSASSRVPHRHHGLLTWGLDLVV